MNDSSTRGRVNTISSYGFRAAVAIHLLSLVVLYFVVPITFLGTPHFFIGIWLTVLMAAILLLFIADMSTSVYEKRGRAKLVDVVIGVVWLCVVGPLLANNIRTGLW